MSRKIASNDSPSCGGCGGSFARIAQELDISKPTLIKWSHKFQFEIQNQRAILLENLQEKWLSACDARVNALGEQLSKIESELAKRDVTSLPTTQLFRLADLSQVWIQADLFESEAEYV